MSVAAENAGKGIVLTSNRFMPDLVAIMDSNYK